jgi:uncharacterized protein (UPF0261 family)
MATVVLMGTPDTKAEELRWVRDRVVSLGCDVTLLDVGTFSDGTLADIAAGAVIDAGGGNLEELRRARDRGAAMDAMGRGAAVLVDRLHEEGRLDALLAIGGSSGSSVAARAMQALGVGVPKLLVSTMASGDVSPYVGQSDVTIMHSVVDIAGLNAVSRAVLGNAAAAAAGMAASYARTRDEPVSPDAPKVVAATMFGLTTPAVDEAREHLAALGYEVLVFHATGSGGRAMETLAAQGALDGVLDLTTTELADDLVGGVLTAGPDRLEAAGRYGVPQVVSLGALDMVNFGPRESVPDRFDDRQLLVHNPTVTLMRTSADEMAALGGRIAAKLAAATGPTEVLVPLRGLSGLDVEGMPFRDEVADERLFDALRAGLAGTSVPVRELDLAINDLGFGRQAAQMLHDLITARGRKED